MLRFANRVFIFLSLCHLCSCEQPHSYQLHHFNLQTKQCKSVVLSKSFMIDDRILVINFFSPNCPLSLKQLPKLLLLKKKYAEKIRLVMIVPRLNLIDQQAMKKLLIPANIEIYFDDKLQLVNEFEATVTPQYFIRFNEELYYNGPFDNSLEKLSLPGKSRFVNYVDDVIHRLLNKQTLSYQQIPPVGCYIF